MAKRKVHSLHPDKIKELKRELAWEVRRAMSRHGYSQEWAAIVCRTSRHVMRHCEYGDVDRLTFNQLFRILVELEPKVRILIAR